MTQKYFPDFKPVYSAWASSQAQVFISSFRPTVATLVFLLLFGYAQQCWLSANPAKACPSAAPVGLLALMQQLPRQTINLGVRSLEVTQHAGQRMTERGVSVAEVRAAVEGAQLFAYLNDDLIKIGYYDHKTGLFLAVDQRHAKLITVIRNVSHDYPERLITSGRNLG